MNFPLVLPKLYIRNIFYQCCSMIPCSINQYAKQGQMLWILNIYKSNLKSSVREFNEEMWSIGLWLLRKHTWFSKISWRLPAYLFRLLLAIAVNNFSQKTLKCNWSIVLGFCTVPFVYIHRYNVSTNQNSQQNQI